MEKNKALLFWIVAVIYYGFVLFGVFLGWYSIFELEMFILLFLPLPIISVCRIFKFRALSLYLERNHPEAWGRMSGRWLRNCFGRTIGADIFSFSGELDEDACLRAMKKNFRHLALLTYVIMAVIIIFVLFLSARL